MKRQFILPSLLGAVLMLCLLTLHASILQGTSQSTAISGGMSRTETHYTYGVPTMVRIVDSEVRGVPSARRVIIGWHRIAAVLVIAWCVCMPIGRWVTGYVRRNGDVAGPIRTGWSHPAAIVSYVLAGCLVVATIAAVVYERTFGSLASLAEGVLVFFLMLMVVSVPVTVIVMIVRRWLYRARIEQRGFAVEMPVTQA